MTLWLCGGLAPKPCLTGTGGSRNRSMDGLPLPTGPGFRRQTERREPAVVRARGAVVEACSTEREGGPGHDIDVPSSGVPQADSRLPPTHVCARGGGCNDLL